MFFLEVFADIAHTVESPNFGWAVGLLLAVVVVWSTLA